MQTKHYDIAFEVRFTRTPAAAARGSVSARFNQQPGHGAANASERVFKMFSTAA